MDSFCYFLVDLHSGAMDGFYSSPIKKSQLDWFNKRYIGSCFVGAKIEIGKISPIGFEDFLFHTERLACVDSVRLEKSEVKRLRKLAKERFSTER